jgi:pyrroloquinoline quinone (PQQ) biosynthesis protein C
METPLQNLKYYFRNNDTITKEELNNAIDELYDNERSAIMDAAKKFANTLGVEDEDILDYYNDLYKTN